jgi:DNA modification methylase
MEITQRKTADLIPYVNNARTHSEQQVLQIAASIKEFGFNSPVLVDGENGIIAGHGRVMAAKKLNLDEVPTIELKHLTKTQKKAYILADNRLALNSGWDNDLLALELGELSDDGFDLDLLGFDDTELSLLDDTEQTEGLTDEDAVPEVPDDPITKLGDVWLCGNHRVMCGDSTSIDAVDKLMDGNKADMVFTDPPYGMFLDADYSSMGGKGSSDLAKKSGNKYDAVIGDNNDFSPELINTIFANFSYCKEVFMWGADYYAEHIDNKNIGSWVVWDKRGDESADKMYGSTFELCWSKARHKRIMARVKWAGIFGMEKEHDKKRCHPTQKPVALVDWFMDYFSLQDAVNVVDLYGGSGATLLSCDKHNKKCYMMELDPKYCDVIVKRWQDFTGKQATLELTGETYGSHT